MVCNGRSRKRPVMRLLCHRLLEFCFFSKIFSASSAGSLRLGGEKNLPPSTLRRAENSRIRFWLRLRAALRILDTNQDFKASNQSISTIGLLLSVLGLHFLLLGGAFIRAVHAADYGLDKGPLQLSLKQAVDLALAPDGNTRIKLAAELIRQARSRSTQSRAALLPNVDGSVGQQNRTLNLSAIGIQIDIPIPGFHRPSRVGPFDTFDARAVATQNILDISSIRRFQASRSGLGASEIEGQSAEDQVAGQVAKLYLLALRTETDLEAAKANVTLSEALLKLAADQKEAGTGTGIDVTRARVQHANDRQRLLVAENQRAKAHLELLRALALNLDVPLHLTDLLTYLPYETVTIEQALKVASHSRADLKAQEKREEVARLNYSATKLERLPSLVGFADYGTIGSSSDRAIPTRTYGFSVRLPIFDGGRRDGRRAESASQWQQERIKTKDLYQQIELEVRLAFDNLRSAEDQVKVSNEGQELAQSELQQARRRYAAGVASGLEVTDAQTRLERSRDNQISALFNYNLARLDLGLAMGTVRQLIK